MYSLHLGGCTKPTFYQNQTSASDVCKVAEKWGIITSTVGGGFKHFLFSPLFGEDAHVDYVSDGLVQPPTSNMVVWVISEDFRDDEFTRQGIWWESLPLIDQAKSRFFVSQLLLDFTAKYWGFQKRGMFLKWVAQPCTRSVFFHVAMFRTTDSPQVLVANWKGKGFIPEQNPGCNSPRLLSIARYLTGNWYRYAFAGGWMPWCVMTHC